MNTAAGRTVAGHVRTWPAGRKRVADQVSSTDTSVTPAWPNGRAPPRGGRGSGRCGRPSGGRPEDAAVPDGPERGGRAVELGAITAAWWVSSARRSGESSEKWAGARDSNPGPHGPEPCALPDGASPRTNRDPHCTAAAARRPLRPACTARAPPPPVPPQAG